MEKKEIIDQIKNSATETIRYNVQNEDIVMHPWAGLFWPKESMLIVSDTHFGKITHFRKSGLAIPMAAIEKNWSRLAEMINHFNPTTIVFLGDLFHSEYNQEWESFQIIGDTFPHLKMVLIMGNHDILHHDHYHNANLEMKETWEIGPFILSHHPLESTELYNIYGHIHPAVVLRGLARQHMKLPCFFFSKNHAIMPAFGSFTGTATVMAKKTDHVFVIAKNKILKV